MSRVEGTSAGGPGAAPSLAGFGAEVRAFWRALPDKGLFGAMLVAWVALFHFLGNSTLGYTDSPSLFGWLRYNYDIHPDNSHGYLIPLAVAVLSWVKRRELLAVPKAPWWPALALVVGGLVLHLVGYLIQQTRLSVVAFFVGLYGLTGLVWGWSWMKATCFPFFLFAFCVPLGGTLADGLTFPLRMLVTKVSVGLADVLGIEVIRQGTQIVGAGGFQYDVAPACSGIRSLTALLALTTIYGFLMFRAPWKRALMMLIAIPLAVVGNVARITGVLVTAEAFGQQAGTRFHDGAGFVTFAVAIACVLGLGFWLREDVRPAEGTPS